MRGNISKYSQALVLTAVLLALQIVIEFIFSKVFEPTGMFDVILSIVSAPVSALVLGWIYALVLDKKLARDLRISVVTFYVMILLVTGIFANWSLMITGVFRFLYVLLISFFSTIVLYYVVSICIDFMPTLIVKNKKSKVFKVSKEVVEKIDSKPKAKEVVVKKQTSKKAKVTKKQSSKTASAKKVKTVKKVPAKKASAKKTPVKKAPVKKAVSKKAPVKKVTSKKAATKKTVKKTSKKATSKKAITKKA